MGIIKIGGKIAGIDVKTSKQIEEDKLEEIEKQTRKDNKEKAKQQKEEDRMKKVI